MFEDRFKARAETRSRYFLPSTSLIKVTWHRFGRNSRLRLVLGVAPEVA